MKSVLALIVVLSFVNGATAATKNKVTGKTSKAATASKPTQVDPVTTTKDTLATEAAKIDATPKASEATGGTSSVKIEDVKPAAKKWKATFYTNVNTDSAALNRRNVDLKAASYFAASYKPTENGKVFAKQNFSTTYSTLQQTESSVLGDLQVGYGHNVDSILGAKKNLVQLEYYLPTSKASKEKRINGTVRGVLDLAWENSTKWSFGYTAMPYLVSILPGQTNNLTYKFVQIGTAGYALTDKLSASHAVSLINEAYQSNFEKGTSQHTFDMETALEYTANPNVIVAASIEDTIPTVGRSKAVSLYREEEVSYNLYLTLTY